MKICATCESDGRNGSKTGNSYGLDGSRTCDISYSDGSNGSNIGENMYYHLFAWSNGSLTWVIGQNTWTICDSVGVD